MAEPVGDLPRNLRWEMAEIRKHGAVRPESVMIVLAASEKLQIRFDIRTDSMFAPTESQILDTEPFVFEYQSISTVGREAPRVLSCRGDFPRDLLHLNPGSDEEPAWLCLARTGLQPIYDAAGVSACIDRLSSWLGDAKAGALHEDGWEPTPVIDDGTTVIGQIDAAWFQTHAANRPAGGSSIGTATLIASDQEINHYFVNVRTPQIDVNNQVERENAKHLLAKSFKSGSMIRANVPVVFVWPNHDRIELAPLFGSWQSMETLKSGLEKTGLLTRVEDALIHLDVHFGSGHDVVCNSKKVVVLILGLWRPVQLDSTIVGLAQDPQARKLELRVVCLDRVAGNPLDAHATVRSFRGLVPATPSLLQTVSGQAAPTKLVMLGAGALGSAIADFAARGGTPAIDIVDPDYLGTHNLARHRLNVVEVGRSKAQATKEMAEAISSLIRVNAHSCEFEDLSDTQVLQMFEECEQIIDTTGNPVLRRVLSANIEQQIPLVRSEILFLGQLGITFLTKTSIPQNLNCMYYQLIASAYRDEDIRAWLAYEATRDFVDDELLLGFGCSSLTTRMPAYKINSHAAAAYAAARKFKDNIDHSQIMISVLSDDGLPQGARYLDLSPVQRFEVGSGETKWTVIVDESVLNRMKLLRQQHAPNETGGYLYGQFDEAVSEIYVVALSPEPPGTVPSPTELQLGQWGRTGFEKAFVRRTQRRLMPIGTWHSHPASIAKASEIDWKTIESFRKVDRLQGLPTLMGITGTNGEQFYCA